MIRCLDWLFFAYFLSHIPITLIIDFQAILPARYYPEWALNLVKFYVENFKDPLMDVPPGWFKSFVFCEAFLQLPFFFVATYGFYKGSKKCSWLRIPSLIYSAHVATTVWAIIFHLWVTNFQNVPNSPENLEQLLYVTGIYSIYFIVPILLLLRMAFDSYFCQSEQKIPTIHKGPKRKNEKIKYY